MYKAIFLFIFCGLLAGCSLNKTQAGALGTGAAGAGLGAIIGNQTGNTGAGIAIGAAAGTLAGALVGNQLDQSDQQQAQVRSELERSREENAEMRKLIERLEARGADVRSTRRGVVVNLPDVLFKFDSDRLTPEARVIVRDIAEVVSSVKRRTIAVEGYTDSIGDTDYNKDLSYRRARTVARALEGQGIRRSQMAIQGYGEGNPIATNNTALGRQRNRRVEIIVER